MCRLVLAHEVTRTFTVQSTVNVRETSHAQTIYIDDTTAPAFTAPANFTVEGCGSSDGCRDFLYIGC